MKVGVFVKVAAVGCLGLGAVHSVEASAAQGEILSAESTAEYFGKDRALGTIVALQEERADDFRDIRDAALIQATANTAIGGALILIARRGRKYGVL